MCELSELREENEALALKSENSRMRAEIAEMKLEKSISHSEGKSRIESSFFNNGTYEEKMKIALRISKMNMIPTAFRGKPEDVFVAISMGTQLGLTVEMCLKEIAIINGSPCMYGDSLMALALGHAECEYIEEEEIFENGKVIGYRCSVKRSGYPVHKSTFTLDDAKKAGLYVPGRQGKTPWYTYTKRMLQMRARGFAIRDRFADVLRGVASGEEMRDIRYKRNGVITEAEFTIEEDTTQTERLKMLINHSKERENDFKSDDGNKQNEIEEIDEIASEIEREDFVSISGEKGTSVDSIKESKKEKSATEKQIIVIKELLDGGEGSESRLNKALQYYKVKSLDDLTEEKAYDMIEKLSR